MKNVLSVQSSVVYGYAGNKAAVLPMQLSGIDVGHGDAARRAECHHQRAG